MRRLDRLVTIQRRSQTQDASGQEIYTWAALAHRRPAGMRVLSGDERYVGAQWLAKQQAQFELRYASDIADLNPLDRILYPPPADRNAQTPAADTVYDVIDVAEPLRGRKLVVRAARRAEMAA